MAANRGRRVELTSVPRDQPPNPVAGKDDDQWEYYDDSTTLSDFWSTLVSSGLENPLQLWLETYNSLRRGGADKMAAYSEEATPDNVFKEYWRIMVPRLLSPSHRCTSLEQRYDEAKIGRHLIEPLNAFIAGTDYHEDIYQQLMANDSPPVLCGYLFGPGDTTYSCKDCGQDATCVMCDECFQQSEHKNHRYRMSTSDGGGYCDCGDSEAFSQDAMCKKHLKLAENKPPKSDILKNFPEGVAERTKLLLMQILKYVLEVTSVRKKFAELTVGEKDKETWPELRYTFEFSRFCTVLLNDDNHSYPEVIEALKKCLRCTNKLASDLTEYIDKEGRAVIKVGSYAECAEIRDKMDQATRRNYNSLKTEVIQSFVAAHQNFAVRALNWILELFKKSSGFRTLFCEVVFSVDEDVMLTLDGKEFCICEAVLMQDAKVWKEVRKAWFNVVVEGIMKDYESKKTLAQLYVTQYHSIMNAFIGDDQETDISITNLGVQMFTVPSIAENLIEEYNGFYAMAAFFLEQLEEQLIASEGVLVLEPWMDESDHAEFERTSQSLSDLQYLMGVPPTGPMSQAMIANLLNGMNKFLKILDLIQGSDDHERETEAHVEEESTEWEHHFRLTQPVFAVAEYIVKWFKRNKTLLTTTVSNIATMCLANKEFAKKKVSVKYLNEVRDFEVNHYNVLVQATSIHTPLQQFLATLIVGQEDIDPKEWRGENVMISLSRRIHNHGSIVDVVDALLTTQAMLATTKIGMWRRNGSAVDGQMFIYHSPQLGHYQKRNDLLMMQIAAVMDHTDGDLLLASLLHRMQLTEWADLSFEREDVPAEKYEQLHLLGDEFLGVLLALLMERNVKGVANIAKEEELQNRLIHFLCVGSMTHSKIMELIRSGGKLEAVVDDILNKIADYTNCPKEPNKKVFKLKKEYECQYNPFYYFYTQQQRDQAFSNMMAPVKQAAAATSKAAQDEVVPLIPPPKRPRLNDMFRKLPLLSSSVVTLKIIQTTLERLSKSGPGLRDKRFLALVQKQLHKVLFLINVGFEDDIDAEKDLTLVRTSFTEKAEAMNLLQLLRNLDYPSDLKLLVQHTISKAVEARAVVLKKDNDVEMVSESEAMGAQETEEANARKRRALESRAKILAEMSKRQNKFSHVHQRELKEIDNEEKKQQMKRPAVDSEASGASVEAKCVVAGIDKTPARWKDKLYDCALCKQQQYVSTVDTKTNVFVLLAFTCKSSALCQTNAKQPKFVQPNYLPADLSCGPLVTTCGHVMHSSCYQRFYENLAVAERLSSAIRQMMPHEFLCPGCQRLCNIVIPVLPSLNTFIPSTKHKRETFEGWLKSAVGILSEKYTQNPPQGGAASNTFLDISLLRLVSDDKFSQKNPPVWPQLPQAVTAMVNVFALANYAKNLSLNPTEDDSRVLQLCFQSAAMAIHLTQAKRKGHDATEGLIQAYSQFYDEYIRSIVKICFLLPYSATSKPSDDAATRFQSRFFVGLRSNAIYLMSALLLHFQDTNFLQLDALNVLIALVAAYPALTYPHNSPRPNYGESDAHIIHLCTVLHLLQVVASFKEDPTKIGDMEVDVSVRDSDADRGTVENLSVAISEHGGWSDVRVMKHRRPVLAVKVKMLHFLRCAALFFHVYTDVPLPCGVVDGDDIESLFVGLTAYLGLPSTLTEIVRVPGTRELIDRLLSSETLRMSQDSFSLPYPVKRRDLIDLPEDYTVLLKKAAGSKCPLNVTGDCKNPAMCLLCGTVVCLRSHCCEEVIDRTTCGGCTVHARKCSADTAIFLKIRQCKIVLLSEMKRGAILSAPYVDAYGETDDGLSRGNPLKLDRTMFENLRQLWFNHDIPTKVTSSYDRESAVLGNLWYTF